MKHQSTLNNKKDLSKEDILHYRLRTTRHKRRAVMKHRDKQLLAIYRESNAMHKAKRAQPLVELKPPVMRGWKRYFIVREDVAQSRDGSMFERILEKINTVQTSHRRDFKKKKRKFGKKIHVIREQALKKQDVWEWRKAAFTEKEAACFDLHEEPADHPRGAVRHVYVFREPWRYMLRIRPNLITKMKVPNSEVESRLAEIDGYLDHGYHWKRLDTLRHGGGYHWWGRGPKHSDLKKGGCVPFKNLPLYRLMNDE